MFKDIEGGVRGRVKAKLVRKEKQNAQPLNKKGNKTHTSTINPSEQG